MGRYGIDWDKGQESFTKEDKDKIITETTKIIEERTQSDFRIAVAFYDRGITFGNRDEYDKSILDFTSVIELLPDCSEAYLSRAVSYYNLGKYNESLSDIKQSSLFDPIFKTKEYISDWRKDLLEKVNDGISY